VSNQTIVSVIINFYNAEEFIQEAIGSVLNQRFDQWELLLVDDGSTDQSTDIARRYAKQYPQKVRYLQHNGHHNRGASASRNLGSSQAKGDYIAFLDADDVWLPHKLEHQVSILESQPIAAMVYSPALWWYSWTGNPEDIQRDFMQDLRIQLNTLIKPPKLLTLFLRKESAVPSMSSILVRHDVLERVGRSEEAIRSTYDDQVVFAKLALEEHIFVSDKCCHLYRQHPKQRCYITFKTGRYHAARQSFLNWLQEHLSEKGVKDGEVRTVLRRKLWLYSHPNLFSLLRYYQQLAIKIKKIFKWMAFRTLPISVRNWLGS
jgi:glycosyltransferase involved in cell wall biosynthesis